MRFFIFLGRCTHNVKINNVRLKSATNRAKNARSIIRLIFGGGGGKASHPLPSPKSGEGGPRGGRSPPLDFISWFAPGASYAHVNL